MRDEYAAFLASKAPRARPVGIEPGPMPEHLFDFQAHTVGFCVRQGRAAIFQDTGLGKTRQELEWCHQMIGADGWALLLTTLAVARQIEAEGLALGYNVRVIRSQAEAGPGINICNYDMLDALDPAAFIAVALDESGILKNMTGKTSRALINAFADTPYRLAATATPAPNDHTELGMHAEFLGVMTQSEMLVRWFINDSADTGSWRIKGHAQQHFWDWVASWARCAKTPEDLGFDGSRYVLPELKMIRHRVAAEVKPKDGMLFGGNVSATDMFALKRQTSAARAEMVASLVRAEPDEAWVIWCDTDDEQDAIMRLLPEAADVRGKHSAAKKESDIAAFIARNKPWIVTKSSICGHGLNWQFCARAAWVGRTFSYVSFYQSLRRCYRFGQTRPVHAHLIVAEGEDQIGRVIDRKAVDHVVMQRAMAAAMKRDAARLSQVRVPYVPIQTVRLPAWLT